MSTGNGKVFRGDTVISNVRYSVMERQSHTDVTNMASHARETIPTMGRVTLTITEQSPAIRARHDERLTLEMEDGRHLNFYWFNGAMATGGIY